MNKFAIHETLPSLYLIQNDVMKANSAEGAHRMEKNRE
uniref:Uncharacterized protein n=1 Tax=Anguilla anguilla TaxID=7936 RepID=A0A0E9TDM5_ANGAN